ncbi:MULTISPECIES: hypothetical protein [Neptuniibacter]|jgi:hypothetical protein|uniref:hypothetical protein n=1 Tax=Neptuniibacter TaxID=459520 RepID=UPI00082C5DE6|nr:MULTISPECIES: hypothetical protein [Neptuniibacter]MDO6513278.1 hypothetical protein [Neptuniibacter sp. 2_MG-2023]MDO6595059.1 hypothetical protein [Neptuniibacter sp. 1_MG-2023]
MTEKNSKKYLHHLAVGTGFVGLILWFYIGRELGFLDWITQQMPDKYAGSGLMLGIMILMTPGFFLWSRFNRWAEKKLNVSGIYYEDEYYKNEDKLKQKKK